MTAAPSSQSLRCYFISQCVFPPNSTGTSTPVPQDDGGKSLKPKTDIRSVSDKLFLEKASENTLEIYQKVMWSVEERFGPVIEFFEVEGTRERRVVIGYKMGSTKHFFSALSQLYHFYSLYSARKYVEQFANGVTIICEYPLFLISTMLTVVSSALSQPSTGLECSTNRALHSPSHKGSLPPLLPARQSIRQDTRRQRATHSCRSRSHLCL